MKYKYIMTILTLILTAQWIYADGLLMPVNENYPKDLLKNRMTKVTVKIHGLIAETSVYQEFLNEGYEATDAVYSFPLPPDARAVEFLYWDEDQIYKAVLKVKEQDINPGTGEGGVVAEVNKYIGRNGIKVRLKDIQPGKIQKVELHYISLLDYYQGKCSYRFPLNTEKFVEYPVEHVQFNFEVESNSEIASYGITSHSGSRLLKSTATELHLELSKPKAYLTTDLEFFYQVNHTELGVDFYSVNNDTIDGHFALFIRPKNIALPDSVLQKRVLFLLSTSGSMAGYKLSQSISAISQSLDQLNENDQFNIVLYDYSVKSWKATVQQATAENIQQAKDYLSTVSASSGSKMGLGLEECLSQITDSQYSNSILVFTDGFSALDPREIETLNTYKTGIFPIGVGDNLGRARLEMTAALNYGFVTYISDDDNLKEKMLRVFSQISQPVLKDVTIEYGKADISETTPEKLPSTYAGSYFFTAGRYSNPGESALSLGGYSVDGMKAYDFRLEFSGNSIKEKFVQYIWAKQMIDALEYEIEIYGETEPLKERLIDLSLTYNIRCRYTAYIADYETEFTDIGVEPAINLPLDSYIAGNYPNPFNPLTNIRIFIDKHSIDKVKLLKIYNLLGQLVAVIDISHLQSGWHIVKFNAKDMFGNLLPSGIYFVQLQVGNNRGRSIKVNLVK